MHGRLFEDIIEWIGLGQLMLLSLIQFVYFIKAVIDDFFVSNFALLVAPISWAKDHGTQVDILLEAVCLDYKIPETSGIVTQIQIR